MNDKLTKLREEVLAKAAEPAALRPSRFGGYIEATLFEELSGRAAPILAKALKLYMEIDDPLRDTDEIRADLAAIEKELP